MHTCLYALKIKNAHFTKNRCDLSHTTVTHNFCSFDMKLPAYSNCFTGMTNKLTLSSVSVPHLLRVMNAAARVLTGARKFDRGLTQLMTISTGLTVDVPELVKYNHLDSSLPRRYRASVSSCRLCSGVRDGTEMSSTLRCSLSARRAVVSSELMWPSGVLCTRNSSPRLLRDTSHNTIASFGHSLKTKCCYLRVLVHSAQKPLGLLCVIRGWI